MNLVSVQVACRELGISRATLYRLLHQLRLGTYERPGDRMSYVDLDALRQARNEYQPRWEPQPAPASKEDQPVDREEGQPTRTVAAVITYEGKILLTQRQPIRGRAAVWSWLGGMIEAEETPEQAIHRELAEELRADVKVLRYLGVAEEHEDMSQYWGSRFAHGYEMHLFHVAALTEIEASDIIDHEELAGVGWFTPHEFSTVLSHLPPRLVDAAVRFARAAVDDRAAPTTPASETKRLRS
jgi:ADP-ribose pyrophosphatase YjhB (NUDIX family)